MNTQNQQKIFELHAQVCKSLSNPTRLRIMNELRSGEKSVSQMIDQLRLPKANLSQHLAVLRQARIVRTRREGLNIYYSILNPKMIKACDLLREVLFEQLAESENLAKEISLSAQAGKKK